MSAAGAVLVALVVGYLVVLVLIGCATMRLIDALWAHRRKG